MAGHAPHDGEGPEDWTDLCLAHALGSSVSKLAGGEEEEEEEEEDSEGSEETRA